MGEATALLKSLHRAKLMAVKCKSVGASLCGEGDPDLKVRLLDGGATHPLRTGLPDELEKAELVHGLGAWSCVAQTRSGDWYHSG